MCELQKEKDKWEHLTGSPALRGQEEPRNVSAPVRFPET